MSKYKVGDKVVLTVTGTAEMGYFPRYVLNDNFNLWKQSIDELVEPLSTYTEPLEAKIRRQAAEITRLLAENKRLKAENEKMGVKIDAYELYGDQHEEECNQAFNQGTEAAWELARKIILLQSQGGMNDEDYKGAFGSGVSETYVIKNYTYAEAAAKVAEWERQKEEIKVGDIIRSDKDSGFYALIVNIDKEIQTAFLITENRSLTFLRLDQCFKTGRHIDSIEQILKQIGGEQE